MKMEKVPQREAENFQDSKSGLPESKHGQEKQHKKAGDRLGSLTEKG